jgi:hypothetical protein
MAPPPMAPPPMAPPPPPPLALAPVTRAFHPATGEHFYTRSAAEAAGAGFTIEAAAYFYVTDGAVNGKDFVPLYRCNLVAGKHFYTTAANCEGAAATNEGPLGDVAPSAECGATALYRLFGGNGDHFYTVSAAEVQSASAGGYHLEGIIGYVWLAPSASCP